MAELTDRAKSIMQRVILDDIRETIARAKRQKRVLIDGELAGFASAAAKYGVLSEAEKLVQDYTSSLGSS